MSGPYLCGPKPPTDEDLAIVARFAEFLGTHPKESTMADQHPFEPSKDNPRRCTCGEPQSAVVHQDGDVAKVDGR